MISAVSAPIVHTSPPPGNLQAGRSNVSLETQTTEENPSQSLAQLTAEEKVIVEKLKKIDQEVRAHEQAHKNAGGQFAESASFGFEIGPDGRRYAVSGEVPIDIAPVDGDPAATIAKMNAVSAAALAPAKPSSQDRQVAAQAAAIRAEAQAELVKLSRMALAEEENGGEDSNSRNISALEAYEAGVVSENSKNISGNILDFFS